VSQADEATVTCYRHPGREAPLRCTRCERPICLEDAVDAPVGYLCPECARQPRRVVQAQRSFGRSIPRVTQLLLGAIVVAYLAQQASGEVTRAGLTYGPAIAAGEWWRLVTGAFLHGGLLHVGFNGYLLYLLGRDMESGLGSTRFAAIYAGGLLGGAAGVMLIGWGQPTLGASGAVFGLMGAALVAYRRAGVNPFQSGIGMLVAINLVWTFVRPNISIGGHLGGLVAGAVVGAIVLSLPRDDRRGDAIAWAVALGFGVVALVLAQVGPVIA
jgi:membrane associated rhomboid family serine protease